MIFNNFKVLCLVVLLAYLPQSEAVEYFNVAESQNFSPCILRNETLICDASKMDRIYQRKLITFSKVNSQKVFRLEILNFLMEVIPPNTFQNIGNDLVALNIVSKAFIKIIDPQAFSGCQTLKYLEIFSAESFGEASVVIEEVFSPLLSLEELKLMNLNLQVLSATSFTTLTNLKSLTIQSFFLNSFTPETFQNNNNLISLTFLDIKNSTNFLQTLETWPSFSKLGVKSLSINNCNIKSFPKLGESLLGVLTQLSLAKNPIEQILLEDTKNLKQLEVLSLASTKLSRNSVTGLRSLTNLKELKLIDVTTLTDLPVEIESMTSLESIYLDMSKFDKLSISLPESIKKISALNLQKPSVITSNFLSKCKNLSVLHLMFLPMDNIRFLLENAAVFNPSLRILSLDNTSLLKEGLLEFLGLLYNLEVLYLNSANIDLLSDNVLFNLKSLKKLMLSGNHLRYETINSEGFQSVTRHLTDLDLSRNPLTSLPSCMFHTFHNFEGLNLLENSFICDCRLMWLYESVKKSGKIYPNLNFTCSTGPNDGKFFYQLTEKDLTNCSTKIVDNCTPLKTGFYKVPYSALLSADNSFLSLTEINGTDLKFMFDYFTVAVKELNTTIHSNLDKYDLTRRSIDLKLHSTFSNLEVCLILSRNKIDYLYGYNCQTIKIASMMAESRLSILVGVLAGVGTLVLILIIGVIIGCRKWRRKKNDQHEYCEASSTEYSEPDDTYRNNDQYSYVSNENYSAGHGEYFEENSPPLNNVPPLPPSNFTSSKSLNVIINDNVTFKKQPKSKFRKLTTIANKISKARSSSNIHENNRTSLPDSVDSISMQNLNSGFSMILPRQYASRALPRTPSVNVSDPHSGDNPPPKPRLSNANIQSLLNNADHHLNYFSQNVSNTSLCTEESINNPHSGDSGLGISKVSNNCNQSDSNGASVNI